MNLSASLPNRLPPEFNPRQRHHPLLKVVAWVAGCAVALMLVLVIAASVALHSARLHRYILNSVQTNASEALGAKVHLDDFALHLSNLSLDLYGLTVSGADPHPNPPILQVQHAQAGVRVVSILHRKWYLDTIRVDRPVIKVFVDEHGVSNIPTLKSSSNSKSNTSLFDLGIRHAVLDEGEVYYNNQQSPLSADLHDVDFRVSFDSVLQKYSGRLAYSDGHLVSGTLKPIPHSFVAEFDATPAIFHLTKAILTSGASKLLMNATVDNYANPLVLAQYDAAVEGRELQLILQSSSVPSGALRATGSLRYQQTPNRSLLDLLEVKGDLSSQKLFVKTSDLRTEINDLAAHYSLTNGQAVLQDLRASLLGGELTGAGTIANVAGESHSNFEAALRGISLADVRRTLGPSGIPPNLSLSGVLNAEANCSWGKTLDDLLAHADVTIKGKVVGTAHTSAVANSVPLDSEIHGSYAAKGRKIELQNSYLRTPQTSLVMNGTVSERSSLDLRLKANDLREVEEVADLFRTPTNGETARPLGLAGTASFHGLVQGSAASPRLTGQLSASNFHVNGTNWKVVRTDVDVSPSYASLRHADMEPVSRGRITFDVSTGLTNWSFTKTSPIQLTFDASQLSIADLADAAGQKVPVTGTLGAMVRLHGTELNPIGDGNVMLSTMVAYDQPVQSAKLIFSGTGDQVQGNLTAELPAGSLQGKVIARPQERTYTAQVSTNGIRLEKLEALSSRNINATGVLTLALTGQGSFDNPQLDATMQIPQLVVQKQTITGLSLKMNVANHVADATLSSSAVNTSIQAKARVHLNGDFLADATVDTQSIPLQPLFAIYAPDQAPDLTGQSEIHATLHGPLKDKSLLEAHVTIPVLKLNYSTTIELAAAAPIHIDYKNGVIDLQRASIRGTDTDLQFQGTIPTQTNAPISLLLLGTVNLQLAQLFDPDVKSSGELKFNVNSYGASDGKNIGGQIDVVDANFASGDLPIGLQHGNGVLTLTKDRVTIQKFQGTVGGGTLSVQGGVAYQPTVQFDLGMSARGVRMLYPQGMRESINADLRLAGSTENAVLGGSVDLSELSFTPAFDLTNFISQLSGGVSSPPTPGIAQNIQLNLAVRSTNDVNLVSRTVSVGGSANLQVRGTAAQPVILGRVNLNNGDIILNGDRFVLNGGTVQFVNPSETQPVVNLSLMTTIQEYNIYMRFNGPVNQLHTTYSSDPALPSADIINLLAFGQTTEANSANPSTPANQAAESLVASQVSSQVTSRVSKVAGISQLSINPVLASGSSQGPPGANITIQQRVTGNLFVTFSSNVASTQSQTIQGQYQVTPKVAISGTRDQNGGFAVDALIKKGW